MLFWGLFVLLGESALRLYSIRCLHDNLHVLIYGRSSRRRGLGTKCTVFLLIKSSFGLGKFLVNWYSRLAAWNIISAFVICNPKWTKGKASMFAGSPILFDYLPFMVSSGWLCNLGLCKVFLLEKSKHASDLLWKLFRITGMILFYMNIFCLCLITSLVSTTSLLCVISIKWGHLKS